MSGVRDEAGGADAALDDAAQVDVALSGGPAPVLPRADGDREAEEAVAALGDADSARDEGARAVEADPAELDKERRWFWTQAAEQAGLADPESLGIYLTRLVAEKNARYPEDDAELLAAGMLATVEALAKTCTRQITVPDRLRGVTLVLMRHLVGWPILR